MSLAFDCTLASVCNHTIHTVINAHYMLWSSGWISLNSVHSNQLSCSYGSMQKHMCVHVCVTII